MRQHSVMSGLSSASPSHARNGTFKMSEQIGAESDSVASFFVSFLFWQKKGYRRQGETTAN